MTNGLSPKVLVPLISSWLIGLLLIVLWVIDSTSAGTRDLGDPLFVAGCSFLGAGGLGGALGYRAMPGDVTTEIGPASDELLSDDARDKLGV